MKNKIIIYGADWCGDCRRIMLFLDQKKVDYEYIDIDKTIGATAKVIDFNMEVRKQAYRSIPVLIFPNKTVLIEPSFEEVERELKN